MKIFPTKELAFKLNGEQSETLNRLERRTEKSEELKSKFTDKSFIGKINGNDFKIISSAYGKGALSVMSGKIDSEKGYVDVEIHKIFKFIFSFFILVPLIGFIVMILSGTEKFSPIMILVLIGQILMVRFIFIGYAFKRFSKESLNRLRDVLDIEWIKN